MAKKTQKTPRKSRLIKGELIPITDPAIQAALDKMRRQAKPVVPAILREYAKSESRKAK